MSNQQRPFSWFRLVPFGRQTQPTPPPTPRPTPFRAPAPQPYRPRAPQPRPAIRPPAVTPPPPRTAPTRALFPGVTTTPQPVPRSPTPSTAPKPVPRSPTPSTAPSSPAKSILSSSPTSPTFLPIISSSFTLRSPETKTPAPYSSSLETIPPSPKPAASPTKTAPPAARRATTTTVTVPTSSRLVKPLKESPPRYPESKPVFRLPTQEEKKLMSGKETAGNSKMNDKSAMNNQKVSTKFEKLPRRLVTLIGENKGAIMVLNPNSTEKSYTTGNVFGGKSQTVGKKEEGNTVEGEMGSKKKKEDQSDMNSLDLEESTLFINSNVQGVNNSILDDSSLTHHDPGFHIFFSAD